MLLLFIMAIPSSAVVVMASLRPQLDFASTPSSDFIALLDATFFATSRDTEN